MIRILPGSFIAALTLAAACGGTTIETTTSSTGTGTASSSSGAGASGSGSGTTATTGSSSSGGAGGSPSVGCPEQQPSGSCASYPSGLMCTYGDSVRPDCRDTTTCTNGQWESAGTACIMSTSCPSTEPTTGDMCSAGQGTECTYGDNICYCGCGGGPACVVPPWNCSAPPASPCPRVVPNDGSACTDPGLDCSYGNTCAGGAEAVCTDGFWRWNRQFACPV